MADLFFYGTLRHVPLLACVAGTELLRHEPAVLPGFEAFLVKDANYPGLRAAPGAGAPGILVRGMSDEAVARLDYYEGGHGYVLEPRDVETENGPVTALVYLPTRDFADGGPFDLMAWQDRWAQINLFAAQEVMAQYGLRPAAEVMARYPMILTRATARANAQAGGPVTLRRATRPGDVVVDDQTQPYARFFAIEDYKLRHRRFDGTMGPQLDRAVFVSGDAATVLPYDPVTDRVLLVEQFRMGPLARGDAQVWSLEAIAGRVDPGEMPDQTARREAVEEAGLTLGALHRVHGYYPSPGAKTEYLYSFVAECDLPDSAAGLGGMPGEGEDIRSHVLPFDAAMELLAAGEIENAPLILSLYWLAAHRDKLRARS
ncbi:hypothetical protein ACMU_08645 [Actibacterium mucosum KCTC 23349]|uniref:ADP-ribose pyrophosphatase n=1 Tax=Actibacterium mucosum KCTC 23349 TaxID=1454373 RepID=A0A037ZLX7_9RHOB|nr:gamma-glutamylcyclotransferase [Actibacterium mucosum]KAJ55831.1 hypothetical protein ACMU_08645 [Actibacterium mucosum KCTC 23349]